MVSLDNNWMINRQLSSGFPFVSKNAKAFGFRTQHFTAVPTQTSTPQGTNLYMKLLP